MPLSQGLNRVSRRFPCRVCARPDWCVVSGDPDDPILAFCCRVESDHRSGALGWRHRLGGTVHRRQRLVSKSVWTTDFQEWLLRVERDQDRITDRELRKLSDQLGVSVSSLQRLGIGRDRGAWSFPMRDGSERIIGIRLRSRSGKKFAVDGSKNGLFVPARLDRNGTLFLAEGPTDTAAALDLGLSAVGRPACQGGADLARVLVRRLKVQHLVVVGDRDGPGQEGARSVAEKLRAFVPKLSLIEPPAPFKDLRDWLRGGATRSDVEGLLGSSASAAGGESTEVEA